MSIELREGVNSISPVSVKGGCVGLCRRVCKNQSKQHISFALSKCSSQSCIVASNAVTVDLPL